MGRREAFEITCDRCGRNETVPKEHCAPEAPSGEKGGAFRARIWISGKGTVEVAYDDLCRRCREAVKNYFEKIANVTPEERAERNASEKTPEEPPKESPKEPEKPPFGVRPLRGSGARS